MTRIHVECPASTAAAAELHDRLAEAGQTLTDAEMPSFLLSLRDETGRMVAGCKGELAFKTAHVSELWVAETERSNGVGSRLLKEAEAFSKERGATRLHLETRNVLAKGLYEKLGYTVFGQLPNYDGDEAFWYLVKDL